MKIKLLIILLLSCIVGCGATGYQKLGLTGGFFDEQIAPDTFRVGFQGNGYTNSEKNREMCMLRAAELTSQHGYWYFVIVDSSHQMVRSERVSPGHASTSGHFSGKRYYSSTVYTSPTVHVMHKPLSALEIKCYHSKYDIPEGQRYFDADELTYLLKKSLESNN